VDVALCTILTLSTIHSALPLPNSPFNLSLKSYPGGPSIFVREKESARNRKRNGARLANQFLFLFLKIVFENKNKKLFSVVFLLKRCLANCFRK
jgi:hypothetical protein